MKNETCYSHELQVSNVLYVNNLLKGIIELPFRATSFSRTLFVIYPYPLDFWR